MFLIVKNTQIQTQYSPKGIEMLKNISTRDLDLLLILPDRK